MEEEGGGGGSPPANLVPTAAFTATPAMGMVSLAVAVDGAGSSDPDGTITGYRWSFGDGATASGVTAVHTYTKPGRFQIELTVTDSKGAVDSARHAVVSMSPVAATSYQVTEIPSLGGWYTEPRKVNNAGEVTGFSYVAATGYAHAFLFSGGTIRDLGTLGGAASYGNDINDSGNVVGHSFTATGADRAFCYCNGLMQELPTLGGSYGQAYAINSAGTIVGQSDDVNGTYLGLHLPVRVGERHLHAWRQLRRRECSERRRPRGRPVDDGCRFDARVPAAGLDDGRPCRGHVRSGFHRVRDERRG